jgi:Uma2 family endonuclease
MAATTTHLITVEEFRRLPEDSGPLYHELRHGEVVPVTRPEFRHFRIQKQLEQLLEPLARDRGVVAMELAFRPLPEHELWAADVVYLSRERWAAVDPEDNLAGAPELVIEVLSPSNTAAEIYDKEKLCFETGRRSFG